MAEETPNQEEESPETTVTETAAADESQSASEEQAAETATDDVTPDKEPGGSDGESVYGRRLYRENKKLQDKLETEVVAKARIEERLRLVEEQAARKPEPATQKIYTVAEIEAAVDAGNVTRAQAEEYKFDVLMPDRQRRTQETADRERGQREAQQRPIVNAAKELQAYVAVAPYLNDDKDPRTIEIGERALELQRDYALTGPEDKHNLVAKALAVKQSLGSLEALKKKGEVRNLTRNGTSTHAESGAGGTGDKGSDDVVKSVDPAFVAEWRRTGASDEQVKKYAQMHVDKLQRRGARFGR